MEGLALDGRNVVVKRGEKRVDYCGKKCLRRNRNKSFSILIMCKEIKAASTSKKAICS